MTFPSVGMAFPQALLTLVTTYPVGLTAVSLDVLIDLIVYSLGNGRRLRSEPEKLVYTLRELHAKEEEMSVVYTLLETVYLLNPKIRYQVTHL